MTARQRLKYWAVNYVPGLAGRYPYYGTRVYFPRHAMIVRVVCADGVFEREIVRRMIALARPRTTVMDVGANLGFLSVPVLRDCPTCRVVSFEPSPGSLPFLDKTAANSTYADRWAVIGRALAGESGERDFMAGQPATALFDGFAAGTLGARRVRVPVSTLDAEWERLGAPEVSVVKIDVEGAEGGVLAGGCRLLMRWRPSLIVEWHEPYLARFGTAPASLMEVARQFGYRVFSIPGGVAINDEVALRVQMLDCQNFLLIAREPVEHA